jgi:membrane protease YdiL (CAAX protease family)
VPLLGATREQSRPQARAWNRATSVGLAIALLLPIPPYREPFLHLLMKDWGLSWIEAWEFIGLIAKLTVALGIPLLVVFWERRSLSSIGVKGLDSSDLFAVIAIVIVWQIISLSVRVTADQIPILSAQLTAGGAMYASLPKLLDWPALVANGIAEEIGFRGYAIERIEELTGSTFIAASLPFAVNVAVHAGAWGFYGMLSKAPLLLPFVVLYLWRRNLPACVLAHILIDIRASEL